MISVLIVDDNAEKAQKVRAVVDRVAYDGSAIIEIAVSANEALNALHGTYFDVVVVDVCLPIGVGEPASDDGGTFLLDSLMHRSGIRRPGYIIGLTAYDHLADSYRATFVKEGWQLLQYKAADPSWATNMMRILTNHVPQKVVTESSYQTDVGIVCALHKIELEAVLGVLQDYDRASVEGDGTIYYKGLFADGKKSVSVVAAASSEMGMTCATATSMNMINAFRPKYLAMAGIAAGVSGDYGDILIADQSWDYGSGKNLRKKGARKSIFLPAPSGIPIDADLKSQLINFAADESRLASIRAQWQESVVPLKLRATVGPVASGAAVVENRQIVEEIKEHNRKVIGVEMETYGVFTAARMCTVPRPRAMSIKSICDFADSDKDDEYQRYAAFTSARFLREFALEYCGASIVQRDIRRDARK